MNKFTHTYPPLYTHFDTIIEYFISDFHISHVYELHLSSTS